MEFQGGAEIFTEGKVIPARSVKRLVNYRGPDSPLYSATCPLVYVFRVFGVAPYEFVDDTLIPSCVNSIFSFIWMSIYTYITYIYVHEFFYIDNRSPVLGHTETAKTILNYVVAIIDIVAALWTRKKVAAIWNAIQSYDEKVHRLGYSRNERGATVFVWSTLAINLFLWTAINRLGMYAFMETWLHNASYMIIYVGTATSVTKFAGIVLLLGERFHQLNDIAKKNSQIGLRWINVTPMVDAKTIERLHDELMIVGETLESTFSWSLMVWLANLCFHSVSDLYFVIDWIMKTEFQWSITYCLSLWIASFNLQLILLNYACHYASTEANAMAYIMLSWKRWVYTRDKDLIVETSLHMMNRKLNFSAAGCFNVNLPLLRSIAALMTTYLVILLQIEPPE